MATLTVYPVAGTNSPCDGYVGREGVDETFGTKRAGAGNTARIIGTTEGINLVATATSNQYGTLGRNIFNFDTSSLGAGAIISSAVLSLWCTSKFPDLGTGGFTLEIVGATPNGTNTLINGDYGQLGGTSFASTVYASITAGAYNDFTLNASGITNISKTGISSFGGISGWDLNNSFGGAWASSQQTSFIIEHADNAGNKPKLVVTYTPASPSASQSPSASLSPSASASSSLSPSPSSSLSPSASVSPSASPSPVSNTLSVDQVEICFTTGFSDEYTKQSTTYPQNQYVKQSTTFTDEYGNSCWGIMKIWQVNHQQRD